MVVCLVLLFAVSWLPLYLADLLIDWEKSPPSWLLQARPFAQWLGLTNSSLNPICYCFIGDLYRSAKVIRTRYYQKVAALFGSSTFSKSTVTGSPSMRITDTKRSANEQQNLAAAAMVASTSMVTIPRLLSLARGQGVVQRVRDSSLSRGSSAHSISDWCHASPMCDRAHCHLADFVPLRRHSTNEDRGSLPLQIESTEVLPLRRHSGDRLLTRSEKRDIVTMGRDVFCLVAEQQKTSMHSSYFPVGGSEEESVNTTSL